MNRYPYPVLIFLLIGSIFLLPGCQKNPGESAATITASPLSTHTTTEAGTEISISETPASPTATQEPLAASIDQEGITMAEYEAELARFHAAGTELATVDENDVIEEMITEYLLARGAAEAGYIVDDMTLQERIDSLGLSETQLAEWRQQNLYTEDQFRDALRTAIAAGWMRDQIVASVPAVADQVHAQQILVYNNDEAAAILDRLDAGASFGELASEYEPITGGEIGWFPRGYLTEQAVEDAAFSLQPGEHSDIIETRLGYHVVYVSERDSQHPLTTDARQLYQHQALTDWLDSQHANHEIQIYLP